MADPRDHFELVVNGRRFSGWTRAGVECGIELADRRGSLTQSSESDGDRPALLTCPIGSDVQVYAVDETTGGRDLLLTGTVEGLRPLIEPDGWELERPLYSRTLDVVLSEAYVGPILEGLTRLGIVRALCAPHGVEVVAGDGVTDSAPIGRFKVELGETVYAAIVRATQPAAWLVTDDAQGRLVLTRAGTARAETALVLGQNIIRLGGPGIDATQRFSDYVSRGQRDGDDADYGDAVSQVYGEATDAWQQRRRRISVDDERARTPAQHRALCHWEAAQRAGRSVAFDVDVVGVRQRPGGPLWEPNQIVPVQVPSIGLDAELLITACAYSQTAAACRTKLSLAPVVGFLPFIPPAAERQRPRQRRSGLVSDIQGYLDALAVSAARRAAALSGVTP